MRVDAKPFYADLFSLRPGDAAAEAAALNRRQPPPLKSRPLALPAPAAEPAKAAKVAAKPGHPVRELIGDVDLRRLTPRQMANISFDLYAAGALSFDDYSALAFQPELHPDFDRTIGALTGERAAPDRPRDFVEMWRERADFQRRHNAGRPDIVAQHDRIAAVLARIDAPTDVTA
jgi:hypothetical protein